MNMVVSELESLIYDLGFSGISDCSADSFKKIERIKVISGQLEMKHLRCICEQLDDSLRAGDADRSARLLCRLCMYSDVLSF